MKKIFGILSALLIIVCFTNNEANAYTINDGGGEIVTSVVSNGNATLVIPMVVAVNPTTVDNVVVVSSVNNVVASVTSYKEVGGSIISSDSADPDQDNLVANHNSKRTKLMHLLSLRKHKKYLASNDNFNSVTNDNVGNITANVGKLKETYTI
jgi:hypothetical protein